MFDLETPADMAEENNRKDAMHYLDRAQTDAELADWARKYGRHLCAVDYTDLQDELDKAASAANLAEMHAEKMQTAINRAYDLLDALEIEDGNVIATVGQIDEIITVLEAVA